VESMEFYRVTKFTDPVGGSNGILAGHKIS
jgi:hypothetical protein